MSKQKDDFIDMKAVAARLHHEVCYLEAMCLMRNVLKASEEEMLQRLAALFGYDDVDAPQPTTYPT